MPKNVQIQNMINVPNQMQLVYVGESEARKHKTVREQKLIVRKQSNLNYQ